MLATRETDWLPIIRANSRLIGIRRDMLRVAIKRAILLGLFFNVILTDDRAGYPVSKNVRTRSFINSLPT